MVRRFWLVLFLLMLSCEGVTEPTGGGVPLGSDFSLALGEAVSVEGTGLSIRFVDAAEDSRCPPRCWCLWPGNARVELEVRSWTDILRGGRPSVKGSRQRVSLSTLIGPSAVSVGRYEIRLISLAPESAPEVRGDYEATLRVMRH